LRPHRQHQLEERLRSGSGWIDVDLVFCGAHGLPLDGSALTKGFQRFLIAAKLPKIRFHDLRHTCATLLLSSGTPLLDVSALLGHSSPTLTLNTLRPRHARGWKPSSSSDGESSRRLARFALATSGPWSLSVRTHFTL
jgi:integrase